MKYALVAAIEGNNRNLNNQLNIVQFERKFEDEAILCFEAWRKNGGWLKDIPIYVLCPTHNTISQDTIDQLKAINVEYIEEYHPVTETFTSGFLNIPYVGMLFEQRLDVDVLIKIDLDMNLIQPLPEALVNCGQTVCGQYDDYCTKQQRTLEPGWDNPFDTGFMITRKDSGFYQRWWKGVAEILNGAHDPDWLAVRAQTGEYYLEEYIVDKIYHEDTGAIRPVQKYQIGEWYTPVAKFTDDELKNVYFWHEHLISDPKYNKIREKVEYFNRMRKINLESGTA
jgi:hypothetical protein